MQRSDLQDALSWDEPTPGSVFQAINIVSKYAMEHGPTEASALEAIIRLRDLTERNIIVQPVLRDAVYSLCREAGLFPYMEEADVTWRDKVAFEFFRGPEDMDYVFHREQWQAFQLLIAGKSLVLSAPTSFGKSVLILAFIAQRSPGCVVIVVPTIALLDQFRRKLMSYFGEDYVIITRNDQSAEGGAKRIYVVTQERLLDRDDIEAIDLLAIDEYYKLDSGREQQGEGSRAALLNIALRRYMAIAKQVFFLGPTVAGIEMRPELRSQFTEFNSSFSTVAVDIHDHSTAKKPLDEIALLVSRYASDKSLIFSKSPPAARQLVLALASKSPLPITREIRRLADWLANNYHPEWPLVAALRAGFGLHHGSVPRSVAQLLVRQFNEGDLQALICTSTLIEGVNTSAKNVFIYDKQISNRNYDYFDFRNIAGRSGRMGHHFIGRIFLFHEPPEISAFQLEIPALGEEEDLPEAVLVNLPDELLSRSTRARKNELLSRANLPPELVQQFAPYGLDRLQTLSNLIHEQVSAENEGILWRGRVRYPELLGVFTPVWAHLKFNKGRMSERAAAFFADRLGRSRSLRAYFDGLVEEREGSARGESIERGFRALTAFDYSIPKVLIDMQDLVNYHCSLLRKDPVDYAYMSQALDNLFEHQWVKALEEYSVPFPLGQKLEWLLRDAHSLEEAVDLALNHSRSLNTDLSPLEKTLVISALA